MSALSDASNVVVIEHEVTFFFPLSLSASLFVISHRCCISGAVRALVQYKASFHLLTSLSLSVSLLFFFLSQRCTHSVVARVFVYRYTEHSFLSMQYYVYVPYVYRLSLPMHVCLTNSMHMHCSDSMRILFFCLLCFKFVLIIILDPPLYVPRTRLSCMSTSLCLFERKSADQDLIHVCISSSKFHVCFVIFLSQHTHTLTCTCSKTCVCDK